MAFILPEVCPIGREGLLSYGRSNVVSVMTGVVELGLGLDACSVSSPIYLSDDELVESADAVMVAVSRLAAVQAGLVREIDGRGLAKKLGASSTLAWLKARYLLAGPSAARLVKLAVEAEHDAPAASAALADGAVNADQVLAIAAAVRELPGELDAETRHKAEAQLVEFAAIHDPVTLSTLGRRILDTVDPEASEAREAELLRKQEERAYNARAFNLSSDHLTGRVKVSGWLDGESAAIVRAAIDPLCAPGRSRLRSGASAESSVAEGGPAESDVVDDRSPTQRRADALVDVCRLALATGDLPDNGGERPQLAVMAEFDVLTGQLKAGTLETGERLSPEAVRRIACDCGLLPGVMDGTGSVLDLGRERRAWTGAARKAILLRDRGCVFPGCDRPPRWTDIHHVAQWQHGGGTDRDNGAAFCGHHHRVIHQGHWQVRIASDGLPELIPPAYVDRQRRPRRNRYHRRP
ncbi:hypothetical protein F4553_005006 [Allocatelliglobosispora scoriae]|uniref:HNH nuclease domain-containing protein n=1 Tax=Allocatelliglobosispora scoriae TaxID=643052 RepID=A0A841BRE7_9ACTN|nr:HNH endonuclease signature motif containing protein [Allocatelliglobosispora scoriae]MBB5871627.1 hypothetical protein [Allocatelliglobosispora scoriae]